MDDLEFARNIVGANEMQRFIVQDANEAANNSPLELVHQEETDRYTTVNKIAVKVMGKEEYYSEAEAETGGVAINGYAEAEAEAYASAYYDPYVYTTYPEYPTYPGYSGYPVVPTYPIYGYYPPVYSIGYYTPPPIYYPVYPPPYPTAYPTDYATSETYAITYEDYEEVDYFTEGAKLRGGR